MQINEIRFENGDMTTCNSEIQRTNMDKSLYFTKLEFLRK